MDPLSLFIVVAFVAVSAILRAHRHSVRVETDAEIYRR